MTISDTACMSGVRFVTLPYDSSLRLCPVAVDTRSANPTPDPRIATMINDVVIPALLRRLLGRKPSDVSTADARAKAPRVESPQSG